MIKLLLNPFERFAGAASLWIGLCFLIITCIVAYAGNIHLDGVLDLHISENTTWKITAIETLLNWWCMFLFIYIAGLLLSKSSIRIIDVFGTQAMARAPFLIATIGNLFLSGSRIDKYLNNRFLQRGEAVEITGGDIALFVVSMLLTLLALIWMVMWMYRAYCISCNVKGTKSILSFIAALLLAEISSKLLLSLLL
ncbi:MAG: hypothetical protein IT236_18545 [Bacteroidia bacterium]|nr:hypothetical protein [Bacteroidia bacterium]